jgi:hypothetical protein
MKTPLRPCRLARPPESRRRVCRALLGGWLAFAGLAGGALFVPAGPVRATGFDLQALTAMLATRRAAEARFTEERFVTGLEQPLRASGTLSFTAPARFARHTLAPRPESMVVEGNTVTLTRGGRTRQMALDTAPELTALIEAVRGTLGGNAQTLQRHFRTGVSGSPQEWRLTLVPLDRRLGAQVQQIDIGGRGPDLSVMEMWLAGGDRSVMRIETVNAAAR